MASRVAGDDAKLESVDEELAGRRPLILIAAACFAGWIEHGFRDNGLRHMIEPVVWAGLTRRVALGASLMVLEYLALSFRFDAARLALESGEHEWVRSLGIIAPLFVVVGAVTVLLEGERLRAEAKRIEGALSSALPRPAFLIAHGLAFAGFFALTQAMFGAEPERAELSTGLLVVWLALAGLVVASLISFVLPWSALLPFVRGSSGALLGGAVVGGLAWAAGLGTERLWHPMGKATVVLASLLLRLASNDVVSDPEALRVGSEGFEVAIAPSCSGYEGIGLMIVFMTVYVSKFRVTLRMPRALLLIPLSVIAIWLTNVLRIAALILVGARLSSDVALEAFHSKAGWVLFCLVAFALVALSRRLPVLRAAEGEVGSAPTADHTDNAVAAYLMPAMAVVGGALLFDLLSSDFPRFYPLRALAGLVALFVYRRYYVGLAWSWSWTSVAIGVAAFVIWMVPSAPPDAERLAAWRAEFTSLPPTAAGLWLAFRCFGSVIVVPIAEELAFRGYLLRRLMASDFTSVSLSRCSPWAIGASSFAFGLMHERWLVATLVGVLYALASMKRGRLADAVVAHAITNGLIAVFVLASGNFGHWL